MLVLYSLLLQLHLQRRGGEVWPRGGRDEGRGTGSGPTGYCEMREGTPATSLPFPLPLAPAPAPAAATTATATATHRTVTGPASPVSPHVV